jgi:excisionase family DNA binding protein
MPSITSYVGIAKGGFMNTDLNNNQMSTTGSSKRTYTVMEIAGILRIGKSKAYELCDGKQFRVIRIGSAIRVCKNSFDTWFDNQN